MICIRVNKKIYYHSKRSVVNDEQCCAKLSTAPNTTVNVLTIYSRDAVANDGDRNDALLGGELTLSNKRKIQTVHTSQRGHLLRCRFWSV